MHIKNFDPYDFSKKEIDGVSVYYKNLPWAPCIYVNVVFNVGAQDDPVGKEGLSHFLEHMIFNGSPALPDKKAIWAWKKTNTLDTLNAWTNTTNTSYWFKCLPEFLDTALVGAKDIIFNSYLRDGDVEHERKVITQEAWGRYQNQKYLDYQREYTANMFAGHSHERISSALGWPDTVAKITAEDVKGWHKKNYGLGNFFVVLAGAVEDVHVDSFGEFLKDLPKASHLERSYGEVGKPKIKSFNKTADEIGQVKEQVEISFERSCPGLHFSKNETASVLKRVLRDILHEKLRIEHSLCYGVSVGGSLSKTFSVFYVNVKTEEKNVELVQKEFWKILKEIKDGKFADLFEIFKKLGIEQVRSRERLSGDIADSALNEITRYDGRVTTQTEQLEAMEKVTYADMVELMDYVFDPEYIVTEVILPSKKSV